MFETPLTSPHDWLEDSDGTKRTIHALTLSRDASASLLWAFELRGLRSGITARARLNLRSKRKVKSFSTFLSVCLFVFSSLFILCCHICQIHPAWYMCACFNLSDSMSLWIWSFHVLSGLICWAGEVFLQNKKSSFSWFFFLCPENLQKVAKSYQMSQNVIECINNDIRIWEIKSKYS